ncbi:MAG TPA: hypothetical protein VK812_13205 [Candidatus Binatus sp.]|nr:hypothetical protein [Candidatus Binatus sp.]
MSRRGSSFSTVHVMVVSWLLLACPLLAAAQRHGGGGATAGSGSLSSYSRPTGVDEKDSLKDFHQTMAVQATSQQVAEFQALVKTTEAAQAGLESFLQLLRTQNAAAEPARPDDPNRALDNVRSATRKFQEGFSPAQKAGLKDIARRLAKTDLDLEQEEKRLDQVLESKAAAPEIIAHAESLQKAVTECQNQQFALGREMSITQASGQDIAFVLPQGKSIVSIGSRSIPVAASGVLTKIADQGSQRTFKVELAADLSELQQNIFEILQAQLDTSQMCGQRVAIRQATLTPATPASLVVVRLHFERWICTQTLGRQTANELAEGDGRVEIKLTAAMETPNAAGSSALKITAAFGRIDAAGMLGEELRSGSLGEDLRDQVVQSVWSAARAGSDFKSALPLAVQSSAVIQSAKFQDVGVGGLSVVFEGQIKLSNEQADQLASQINQTLQTQSAQSPAAR